MNILILVVWITGLCVGSFITYAGAISIYEELRRMALPVDMQDVAYWIKAFLGASVGVVIIINVMANVPFTITWAQ